MTEISPLVNPEVSAAPPADFRGTASSVASLARIDSVHTLRGIAALSVVWFHLTNGNAAFLQNGGLKASGSQGWLGVEVFFVLSGFIIPFALYRSGYALDEFPRFAAKRIVRLDPPYFAAALLALALGFASSFMPGFGGEPPKLSWVQLFAHIGYLNSLLGRPWLNPAFWSLAIEFQYYLSLGLLFPVLSSSKRYVRLSVMILLSLTALLVRSPNLVFSYEFLFLIGIVTFQYKCRIIGIREWTSLALLCTVGEWTVGGGAIALIGAVTALLILTPIRVFPATALLGDISYSLYLTHTPIGGRIINLGARLPQSTIVSTFILMLGLIGSLSFAYLFFRLVEEPSRRLASSIQYRYVGRS